LPVTSYQKNEVEEFRFDFENLKVYQKALDFIDEVFKLLKNLPREYRFSIGDNLLRAAFSIGNNIAEGNDKASKKESDILRPRLIRRENAFQYLLYLEDKI